MKKKPYYNDIEPKAVTNNELFGIINPQTREWKDGEFITFVYFHWGIAHLKKNCVLNH